MCWSCIKNWHEKASLVVLWSQKKKRARKNNLGARWACTLIDKYVTRFSGAVQYGPLDHDRKDHLHMFLGVNDGKKNSKFLLSRNNHNNIMQSNRIHTFAKCAA